MESWRQTTAAETADALGRFGTIAVGASPCDREHIAETGGAPSDGLVDAGRNALAQPYGAGCGLVVLSMAMDLIYVSETARRMIRLMEPAPAELSDDTGIPASVLRLCHELSRSLRLTRESGSAMDCWRLQFRRVLGAPHYPVLVRGFVIPDQAEHERSRLLVLLDAVEAWRDAVEDARDRFQFTGRESEVVRHLLRGWTNKEIANELGITEQTVKVHVHHVMRKTRVTTRTGILLRVLGLSGEDDRLHPLPDAVAQQDGYPRSSVTRRDTAPIAPANLP
jgi:DNA-binding CsgD family transcriptional regulator